MKLLIVFSLSLGVLAASERPAKKNPVAVPSARTNAAPNEIPKAAVRSDDGTYRYTDRQGKKWMYRKTPFGTAHWEDTPANAVDRGGSSVQRFEDVKATEEGDTIRFERPSPFGTYKWQQKKTQLNEMEQTVWDRQRTRATERQDQP